MIGFLNCAPSKDYMFNADRIQPASFKLANYPGAERFGRTPMETIKGLTELPNCLFVSKQVSGRDVEYTLYFYGFTNEQVWDGAFKAWVLQERDKIKSAAVTTPT